MLNIQNLERRWLKYKIKSYAPYILGVVALLSVFIAVAYSKKSDTQSEPKEAAVSPSSPTPEASSTLLEPSMDFIRSFQTTVPSNEPPKATLQKNTQPVREPLPIPKLVTIPPPDSSDEKSFSLNRNESKLDIDTLERRFKETSNANLGLFIARYHYDHGNYSEAYNFALKTNSISNKLEESWIIFAKSLVKLGKVEQAKKTLQFYITDSNSDAARALLDTIERGTFK
jgi:hypothetical protein